MRLKKNCLYFIYKIYFNYLNQPVIYDEKIVNLIKKIDNESLI